MTDSLSAVSSSMTQWGLVVGWAIVCALAVVVAFREAGDAEAETGEVRMQLAEANARAVEMQHEADYWRGLASWYADHNVTHPTQDECEAIAEKTDKWLPVGTPANPVKSPVGSLALWVETDDLLRPQGGRL